MSAPGLDPTFSDLPHRRLGDVALARAQELGASHADFRFERNRYQYLGARDGVLQTASDAEDLGFAVRVVHDGAWGFASGVVLTDDEARRVAETAVSVAKVAAAMTTTPVELAAEPVHDDVTWVSGYDVNPLEVPTRDKAALLALGKQLAMHIANTNPLSVSPDDIDPAIVAKEREIFTEQAKESGKPAEVIEKMVEGRVRKFYEEHTLLAQTFVIDGESKVKDVVAKAEKEAGAPIKVTKFVRYSLGEGIEKAETDFAAEVAATSGVPQQPSA